MLRDTKPLPGYQEPYGLLAAVLQDGTKEWRGELGDSLSAEAMVWQPHPGLHSVGAIILHIISVEIIWFERFVLHLPIDPEEKALLMMDEIDVDAEQWPEPPQRPLSWYFELQDRIRARTLEGLKRWPDPEETRKDGSRVVTPRWVLGHVIQHEAYHGGQAVLLDILRRAKEAGSTK